MSLKTQFTRKMGTEHPIMLAPMGTIAGGELAAAVSNAGGLGMIDAGYGDPGWLERELWLVDRKATSPWGHYMVSHSGGTGLGFALSTTSIDVFVW